MCQRTEQLPYAITAPAGAAVSRSAVRYGDSQCFASVFEMSEFGVLMQACQYTDAGISDHKLKAFAGGGVSDEAGLVPATMLINVFLELTERPHQATHQRARQPRRYGRILGMARPLLPAAVVTGRIESSQREHAGRVPGTEAANVTGYPLEYLSEEGGLHGHGNIGRRIRLDGKCYLDQRSNLTGAANADRSAVRQSAGPRLPEKIIGDIKGRRQRDQPFVAQPHPHCWSDISRQLRLAT
ncbi:hypothetical protein ABIB83_002505 [Bradyrhizobium sp. I1.8.5]